MIQTLLEELWQALISFIQEIFQLIFGEWNYQAILGWLPQDIREAIDLFILVLFGMVVIRFIRDLIPT